MYRYSVLLILLLSTPDVARAQFPEMPPCGAAYDFQPLYDDGVALPDQVTVTGLPAPSGPFTIEAWIRYDSTNSAGGWPDGFHSIAAFGEANAADRPLLSVRYGALELWSGSSVVRGGSVPLGSWVHVAYTWDGATNRLYVDGQEVASSTTTPSVEGTHFYVGYSRGSTGWRGLIDEMMVWNTTRTAEEILYDASGRLTGSESQLYAYFKFDTIWYDHATSQPFALDEVTDELTGILGWNDPNFRAGSPYTAAVKTPGPEGAEVLSCKLRTPLGLAMGRENELLIAETGTGSDDGAIMWWTIGTSTDAHLLLGRLTSKMSPEGVPAGTNKIAVDASGRALILQGLDQGSHPTSLLVTDTTRSWSGNESPFERTFNIGGYAVQQGFAESNPYAVAIGPEDDYFVVDAGANALFRIEDGTGYMSVIAEFDQITNPLAVGPAAIDAVPASIVYDGSGFFVGAFTGFPFPTGSSAVYQVDDDGGVQEWQTNLTTVVDLAIDPRDGSLIALQFAEFDPEAGYVPETGVVLRLHGAADADTLITGLTTPTAMAFDGDGSLYVATLQGQLLYYDADETATDTETDPRLPESLVLEPNFPNPFAITTHVPFTLRDAQHVRVTVYDVLGREVAVLSDRYWPSGSHVVEWMPRHAPSGIYMFRLQAAAGTFIRQGLLLR